MGKIRKRRLSLTSKVGLFYFVPCLCLYIVCSIFIKSSNNSLVIDIQTMKTEIENVKLENQQLTIDIQTLQNKDRIYTIAEDSGLSQNQDNVINIKGSEMNETK